MVAGEQLPFRKFGYSSVEAFIRNIPDITVIKKNGELYVEAVPSKTSAHLTKLVSRQKGRRKIRPQPKRVIILLVLCISYKVIVATHINYFTKY